MTRFAKLTLLLIVAGALALAGCGGDDNGLSAEDQARISAAEDAAAMAQAEAEAADAAAQAAAEKAAADKMAADEEIAAAKAAADAAQAAADAAQAAADAAQAAAEADVDMVADVDTVWEAVFMPAVEAQFSARVGDMPTLQTIRDAIIAIAAQYNVDIPGENVPTLESKINAHFANAVPSPSTALLYFKMLRAGDDEFLPANRARALQAVTAGTVQQQDVAGIVTEVLEAADLVDTAEERAAKEKAADDEAAKKKAAEEAAAQAAIIAGIVTEVLEAADLVDTPAEKAAKEKAAEEEAAEEEAAEAETKQAELIASIVKEVLGEANLLPEEEEEPTEEEPTVAEQIEAAIMEYEMERARKTVHAHVVKAVTGMTGNTTVAGLEANIRSVFKTFGATLPTAAQLRRIITAELGDDPLTGTDAADTRERVITAVLAAYPVKTGATQVAMATSAVTFTTQNSQVVHAYVVESVSGTTVAELEESVREVFGALGATLPTMAKLQDDILEELGNDLLTGADADDTRERVVIALLAAYPVKTGAAQVAMARGDTTTTSETTTTTTTTGDMTKVAYIDDIIDMDVDVLTMESGLEVSDNENDYATSGLLGTVTPSDAKYGDNIREFSALISEDGFAGADMDARVYGAWGKYNTFGSIADLTGMGKTASYSIGVEADAPTGDKDGSAVWRGTFIGHHNKSVMHGMDDSEDDIPSTDLADVMMGDMVSGRVELDVTFSATGVADTMEATFDKFSTEALENVSHMIAGIPVRGGGSFEGMGMKALDELGDDEGVYYVQKPGTDGDTAGDFMLVENNMNSSIEGQFYGPDGMEAGGVMKLVNGFADNMAAIMSSASTADEDAVDALTASPSDAAALPMSYYITGAFGTEK